MSLTLANYGYVPYGKSLIGTLHLATPRNGCLPLEPFMTNNSHSDPSPIVVMERGGCHFEYRLCPVNWCEDGSDHRQQRREWRLCHNDRWWFRTWHFNPHHYDLKARRWQHPQVPRVKWNSAKVFSSLCRSILTCPTLMIMWKMNSGCRLWIPRAMSFWSHSNHSKISSESSLLFTPHYALWFCPMCKITNFDKTVN